MHGCFKEQFTSGEWPIDEVMISCPRGNALHLQLIGLECGYNN